MSKTGIMGRTGIAGIISIILWPVWGMAQNSNRAVHRQRTAIQKQQNAKTGDVNASLNICKGVWTKWMDSLRVMRERTDSLMSAINIDVGVRQDLLRNPYYFPLFVSPMVYRSALKQEMGINYVFGKSLDKKPLHLTGMPSDSVEAPQNQIDFGIPGVDGLLPDGTSINDFRSWAELNERERPGTGTTMEPCTGDSVTANNSNEKKTCPRYDYSDKSLEVYRSINAFLTDLYVLHPELVSLTDSVLQKQKSLPLDIAKEQQYRNTVSQRVAPARPMDVMEPIVAVSRKPNFWKFTGKVSLKMMQNYNSNNWYQGAVNNSSALWKSFFTMNYNNKEKFHWDNSLEFNLGFQSDRNDKKHKYKTNTDLLRIINSVGLQATGHWYYSASLTSWTQVYPKWNNNSDYVYSDFMSPFESVLSIGMEYKKSAKRWNINVKPSPLSYDFKYCDRKALYSRYGIKGNKHTQEKFGSSLTCTFNWQILDELSWRSYLYAYTNYKSSLVQWENTFSFRISKHLSTDVFIYPRFDDSYHSNKSDAKIQLREYISLGFDYSF